MGSSPITPLSSRWYALRPHPKQLAWMDSPARFNVVPAGRRSGKTERGKRKLVKASVRGTGYDRPRFFAAAPTRDQAKRIYWDDLKRMVPPIMVRHISETELKIELITGASLWVVGLDRPERIEGQPWDGGIVDEYANCKASAWTENIRPALSDRRGWCDFVGVPEGYNHFYDLYQDAKDGRDDWAAYTWWSEDILPPEEIESAKRDLSPEIYRQEYQAEFISFSGTAYYAFDREAHVQPVRQLYQPMQDLILCLDFNNAPGVAVVCQEFIDPIKGGEYTAVLDEVWIEKGSNTLMVMQQFLDGWRQHPGGLNVYGDQTGGGAGNSTALLGNDWDIVSAALEPAFGRRLWLHRPGFNPGERARLNAMNTRLKTFAGDMRLKVDPGATHTVEDFERTILKADGSGRLDKDADKRLSHLTDALGYYVFAEHPMVSHSSNVKVSGF